MKVEFIEQCEKLIELGLSPTCGYILFCKVNNLPYPVHMHSRLYSTMLVAGEWTDLEGNITEKGRQLINEVNVAVAATAIGTLAEKLRELYPQVVLNGGSARGSSANIKHKLDVFFSKYEEERFTYEEVEEAVKTYVSRFGPHDEYAYMMRLPYFIEKNRNSELAATIQGMREGLVEKSETQFQGDDIQ